MNKSQLSQSELVTVREFYKTIDEKWQELHRAIKAVEDKVDALAKESSIVRGQTLLLPTLLASAISIFGLIINLVIRK